MTGKSFLYGALILFIANIINRVLGFVYQIIAFRLVGEEGMGLFYMVYPIYILFIVLSTAGIPIAISKIIAEQMAQGNGRGANRIFRISIFILVCGSIIFTFILLILLPYLAGRILSNPKTYYCLMALAPSILIVAVSSAYRGLFQGLQDMKPTAIAQITEQLVRITIGLYLAVKLLPRGIEYATVGLAVGVCLGELAGLLTIVAIYKTKVLREKNIFNGDKGIRTGKLLRDLLSLSAPITLDRVISTILFSVDAILIPNRLQAAGNTVTRATEIFGHLQGIALPLIFIPTTVTIALATTIIPAISDAQAQRNYRLVQSRIMDALKVTFVVGLPSLAIFYLFPDQICQVVFKNASAGHILRTMAMGAVFLYFLQTITAVFQGLGHAIIPFRNMIIGSLFKIAIILYLTGNPRYGIIGTALAINISWVIESVLDIISLSKITGFVLEVRNVLIKPAVCTAGMTLVMAGAYKLLSAAHSMAASLAFSTLVGGGFYFIFLVVTKTVDSYEIMRIPVVGPSLNRMFSRIGF